jgi:uncharacterized protein (TIGR02452 family)
MHAFGACYAPIHRHMPNLSPTKAQRITLAEDTMRIIAKGYLESPSGLRLSVQAAQENAYTGSVGYREIDAWAITQTTKIVAQGKPTQFEVTLETTLGAVRRLIHEGETDVACLCFSAGRLPGDDFLEGSNSQEATIARSTGLLGCLVTEIDGDDPRYMRLRDGIPTSYMYYCPAVPILKDDVGHNLESLETVGIIAARAMDVSRIGYPSVAQTKGIEARMKTDIRELLAITLAQGHKTVVLGGWGCGKQRHKPKDVARYFKQVIDSHYKNAFHRIVFAVDTAHQETIAPFWLEFISTDPKAELPTTFQGLRGA